MAEKDFNFWLPLDIVKGEDEEDAMRMGGIASTMDEDTDGEFLDPHGFDLSYFLENGVVNWHHQASKDPDAIVGEPILAEIRSEGLYIEVELYKDDPLAVKIYKKAQILKSNSKTRRLGFSIEGKAILRDPNNPKVVKKALITGVAITHMPKNRNTFADILKSLQIANEDEKVELFKGLEDEEEKSLTTASGQALVKESLDEEVKTTCDSDEKIEDEEDGSDLKDVLTKSETYERIFFHLGDITVKDAEKVFNLVQLIANDRMKKGDKNYLNEGVTDQDIQKAVSALGIEDDNYLQKGSDEDDDDEDYEDDEDGADEGSDLKKGLGSDDTSDDLVKAISGMLQKSNKAMGIILKGIYDEMQSTKEIASSVQEENAELRKAIDTLNEELNSAPARKGMVSASQVRDREFQKGVETDLNKGGEAPANTVSVNNKPVVKQLLDGMAFEKGFDADMAKALTTFETSGFISAETVNRVKKEKGITII